MTPRGAATLISWLDSRMQREKAAVLASLPSALAMQLKGVGKSAPPQDLLEPLADRLKAIHYSWFAPAMASLTPTERQAAEASLPTDHPAPAGLRDLPRLILEYWQSWLWRQIVEKDWMPRGMMHPPEELKILLNLSKHQMMDLIDLLGVFDAIPNLRRAIHAEDQKFWAESLSSQQKHLAHKLLQQSAWAGQLPFAANNASPADVSRALHQRGCLRLGTALQSSSDSFIWHIVHHLDRGRGQLVEQAAQQSTSLEAIAAARGALQIALRELSSQETTRRQ